MPSTIDIRAYSKQLLDALQQLDTLIERTSALLDDARRGRFFTVPEAVSYGLIEGQATAAGRPPAGTP